MIARELSGDRGCKADHQLVRLADEGIPVAALARALRRPTSEIWEVLRGALAQGDLMELPAADWPPGSRREGRLPTVSPVRMKEVDSLSLPLQRVFRLTPSEARLLAVLMARREVSKPSLHVAISQGEPLTDPKIVDVFVCKMRRKLVPYQIRVETIWGRGYALSKPNMDAILARLSDFDRQEMAA